MQHRGGQKRAFSQQQVAALEQFLLQSLDPRRAILEYALLRLAVDTMLRGGDLLKLKIGDVLWEGVIVDKIEVRQQKTKTGHIVLLSEKTRSALARFLIPLGVGRPEDCIFNFGIRQYQRVVKSWAELLHLDPRFYSSHSLRRTKAKYVYDKTQNVEAVRELLGQTSIDSTRYYLGVTKEDAHKIARQNEDI